MTYIPSLRKQVSDPSVTLYPMQQVLCDVTLYLMKDTRISVVLHQIADNNYYSNISVQTSYICALFEHYYYIVQMIRGT